MNPSWIIFFSDIHNIILSHQCTSVLLQQLPDISAKQVQMTLPFQSDVPTEVAASQDATSGDTAIIAGIKFQKPVTRRSH